MEFSIISIEILIMRMLQNCNCDLLKVARRNRLVICEHYQAIKPLSTYIFKNMEIIIFKVT